MVVGVDVRDAVVVPEDLGGGTLGLNLGSGGRRGQHGEHARGQRHERGPVTGHG